MQTIQKIARFLVKSNLIVSLSGGFLTYGIARHFSLQHDIRYVLIVFLLIFSVYTLQRIMDDVESPIQPIFKKDDLIVVLLSIGALIVAISIGIPIFNQNNYLLVSTLFFAFLCYWYTVPFFGRKLREIPGIKIIATASTWGYACAFFPLLNSGIDLYHAGLFSLLLLLYLVAIILPFDIRDVHTDYLSQSTIPQIIGIVPTKLVGIFLLLLFYFGTVFYGFRSYNNVLFILAVVSQMAMLLFTSEKRNIVYFGVIDALMTVLGFSYFL